MITRIGCGGFDIDNDTLIEEDGVLKVKNGGGGGGVFVVTMTYHDGDTETESSDYWTADKTCLEIIEALEQGKNVYAVQGDDSLKWYYFPVYVYHQPGFMAEVYFSAAMFGNNPVTGKIALDMQGFKMRWSSDGTNSVIDQGYYSELE